MKEKERTRLSPKQRAGFTNGGAEAKAKGEGTNADTKEDKAI